jgi:outer membrane protein OmpA-like peptidoglycan-associated protein
MPTPKTEEILGAVAATLSVHTEIKKLMVSAYFYSSGMDSFRLAERRAREVVKYLVKSGVDRKRLTVRAIYRNRTDVDSRTTHMYFQVVE